MGLFLALIAAFIVGAAMVELGFTDPDFETASRVFSIVCGIIMMLPLLMMLPKFLADYRKKKEESEKEGKKKGLLRFIKLQKKEPVTEEASERGKAINSFRDSYKAFFQAKYLVENAALQEDVTQLHWNILALQKRRLEKKKMRMEFDSRRMKFGTYPDYIEHTYSDGKYTITEVAETLEARKTFYKDDRIIGRDKCSQLANVVLLDPKSNGKGLISCPNCGNKASRENLLDGCDYCGTKYTIEDLEERVSGFSFGQDYELEYAKYQDARSRFSLWVGLIVGIPVGAFSLVMAIGSIFEGAAEGSGPLMMICTVLLTVAFMVFATVYLSLCFFYFFIFPLIQLLASSLRLARKNLSALKAARETEPEIEQKIREDDPLFSYNGFLANLQNMLATIFMGANEDEMLAFAEGDAVEQEILSIKDQLADVINVSTHWLRIASYGKEEGMSRMIVEGYLTLTKEKDGRLFRENRHIRLQASREEACRTKAVTGPGFTKCPGCNNSMSILSGKKCEYCGRVRKMSSIDWTITHFALYKN